MGMDEGENERYDTLVNGDVRKVVSGLAVPTIISMMVSSIYNMADTFFVSQLNTSASGTVGIIFSAMVITQTLSFAIGMGIGNHMARCLGAGRTKEGETAVSVAFFTGMILGVYPGFVCLLHIDQVVMLLGATETIKPYVVEYARYIFIVIPFMMRSFIMNSLLCLQSPAVFVMIGITVGRILNIVLDPLLIFGLNLGTPGAAVVTGLSQFISFCILLAQCNRRKGCIPIRFRNFCPSFSLYGKIIYGGMPSLTRQSMANIVTVVLNTTVHPLGDAATAAMVIANRLVYFINSAMVRSGQGFQSVYALSYGTKKYVRVHQAYIFCAKFTTYTLTVACVGVFLISGHVISLFRRDDLAIIAADTLAPRPRLITMWFSGFLTISNMMPQPIGYGFRATLLSISRQGPFPISILLLAAHFPGLLGIQAVQPIADACTLVLTVFIIRGIFQSFLQKPQEVRDIQSFQGVRF